MKMEENAELEEGEACYYRDDDDKIDLDSLSYIDERIHHLLGHFQKDFEGGVSAENLGAKFGGYGSFLPAYERSPSRAHPKTPQRNHISPKSPNNIHMEADSHDSKVPPNAPLSIRHGVASRSAHPFQNLGVRSVDGSMKQDIGISSNVVAERHHSKDDRTNKLGNSTDQRTLKFRIKMKSDNLAPKNAAIYSGLGLDNSPSSSMENSNEESGGMPPVSEEVADESPTGIIQAMTSSPIPGGVLISPLHDSLLYLIKKGKIIGASRSVSSINGHQEHCSMSTDESDYFVGDGELLKKSKMTIVGQSERKLELKYTNSNNIENDMNMHMRKRVGSRTPERKEFLSDGLKCTPLSSSICDAGETVEITRKFIEVSKEVNKDGVKGQMASIEAMRAMREESLESISGQDFDKSEKQCLGNSSVEKSLKHKLVSSQPGNSTYPKYNGKCKADKISKKAERDVIKFKAVQDRQKHETYQKEKPLVEGKNKTKGDRSAGSAVSSIKSKMNQTKSLKDHVRDGNRDSLKGNRSEWAVNEMNPVDGLPGHIPMTADLDTSEERNACGIKLKERPSVKKLNDQLIAGSCLEDSLNAGSTADNKLVIRMVPTMAAAPLVIEENWVACDSCQKWRLLPLGTNSDQLPEKWLCSMLDWLPGMNQCNISEEETTNVMRALHQKQISEGQNSMQNLATGTKTGVSSVDVLQTDLDQQNPRSEVLSDRGKKIHGVKEKTKAGSSSDLLLISNSTKTDGQESSKNRSFTNTNHHPADINPLKKSSAQHLSKSYNLVPEKHLPKEKENQINGGDGKLIKLKRKIEADQYRSGTLKKPKTEDLCYADEQFNPGMGPEKVGLNSRNGLPMKARGIDMLKHDEYCLSEDGKHRLTVSLKKQGDQTQFSSDGGSLDVTNNSKRDGSYKKRKLKDWKDSNRHTDMFFLQDGNSYGEENNVSGFRKEKKYKVLNAEAKSIIECDDDLNSKGRVSQVCFSGSRDRVAVGKEVRSIDKAHHGRKHRGKISSQHASDCIDTLGRDGSRQLSLAATSSSSKVSGSHKARTNFEDVKGSPVESVTSSPISTSNLDKLLLGGGDTPGKGTAARDSPSLMGSRRSLDNKEGKRPIKTRERLSYDVHSESHKFYSIKSHVGDAKEKARVLATTSFEVRNDHLLNGGVDAVEQHGHYANGTYHVDKVNKNKQETVPSWQKSGKDMPLRGKEERRSGSEFDKDEMKASALENGHSKNGGRYEPASETIHHASGLETRNDAKYSSPNDNTTKRNFVRHLSSESGKQTEIKHKDTENSVLKVDGACSTNRKILNEQNLIQDLKEKNNADPAHTESRDGKSKLLSLLGGKEKRGKLFVDSRTALGSQKGDMSDEVLVHGSGNGDMAKTVKSIVDASGKGETNPSSGNFGFDRQLTVSSPVKESSSQTALNTLNEATKLRDAADSFKNSGFKFESNETYFEAALKFLHGASLLENHHIESSKHGEMNHMQIYSTTVKLFESCANYYERCREMAAAALAYKCLEVAYMRMVYCKNSSANRDRHELQSTLQMVPHGESPSSSVSDAENLNNQGAVDHRAALPRGIGTHVAVNQVISSRNRPSFVRLLDFAHDTILAMEASRKCQSISAAANLIMEDARNRDCLTSIKSVTDLSFQDVDELVRLVSIARKDITHAGPVGAGD